jgi:hypothetical protein
MEGDKFGAGLPSGDVEFHYRKSAHFRVIFAEGAYGSVTPRGLVHFALYNERAPLPRRTTMTVRNGEASPETVAESLKGMVREVEADVVMELSTAIVFHDWLGARIAELRSRLNISDDDWAAMVAATRAGANAPSV